MSQSIVLNDPTVMTLRLFQFRQNYGFHNFHSKKFHSLMKDCVIRDFLLLVYQFASGREQGENEIILNDNDFSIPIISSSRVLVILEKSLKFLVISQ